MTGQEISDFIGERIETFSRADMSRLNDMLIELPLEEVSEVRSWAMESIALRVNDPLYTGDLESIE